MTTTATANDKAATPARRRVAAATLATSGHARNAREDLRLEADLDGQDGTDDRANREPRGARHNHG